MTDLHALRRLLKACHSQFPSGRRVLYAASPSSTRPSSRWSAETEAQRRTDAGIANRAHRIQHVRRCIHYCPVGVDIAYLMSLVAHLQQTQHHPDLIQDTANSHSATFNQMWVREENGSTACLAEEETARIPRHPARQGRRGLQYSVIAPEPKFRSSYQAAAIFHQAGATMPLPPRLGQRRHVCCDYEMMGRISAPLVLKLRVKRIVMSECGHGFFRSVARSGNRWLMGRSPRCGGHAGVEFY